MDVCCQFLVKGRVQMVGFRYHTAHQGLKLGLSGYAKNLNNGSVEVVACGEEMRVAQLAKWLQQGPITASVESLDAQPIPFQHHSGFKIL
ncbi:acylphosphatase [Vibrio gallicus]|uniref:acylphosphatase n=1 Tax=Vibrio gallicus TaxID=190897 RepID=UPI0021C28771|nr:acylphosphatase [Vibrio gallicus]